MQKVKRSRKKGATQESDARFRLVADTAPVMIWMSGTDKLCNYFNRGWLEFTGRTVEQEMGNGWALGIHPDDMEFSLSTYTAAFEERKPFRMEYRLRRHDGEYRWILDTGVPRFRADGSFDGYIGSCIDVTDHKMAEDLLSTFSGRLIEAQEEERRRIARELHDDYNQSLTVIAVELHAIESLLNSDPSQAQQRLRGASQKVAAVNENLRSLSHNLHSSTLEYLGLVAGVRSFCSEFTEQHGVRISFAARNVPESLTAELSRCAFRVVQEAVRNVQRHSGADSADVQLEGLNTKLHLSVTDKGRGFARHSRLSHAGIGIISMEERVRQLGGRLEIHTAPSRGTTVEAWLPMQSTARAPVS